MKFLILISIIVATIFFFNFDKFTVRHDHQKVEVVHVQLDTGNVQKAKDFTKKTINITKKIVREGKIIAITLSDSVKDTADKLVDNEENDQ